MSTTSTRPLLFTVIFSLILTPTLLADGAGSAGAPTAPSMSPEQRAISFFNQALKKRDKAWRLEEAAADLPESKQAKNTAKIHSYFEQTLSKLDRAVELHPQFFQAHGSRGYALRRLGRYEEALVAYDRALALNPNYPEAIEYRGEAYLGLDRIDDARQAHAQLSSVSPKHAAKLLDAMSTWVEDREEKPNGIDSNVLTKVANWVAHQKGIATTTSTGSSGGSMWK